LRSKAGILSDEVRIPDHVVKSNAFFPETAESKMSNLTQGDRVFHPNQKGWGLGKVLNVTTDNIDVFFVGSGAKGLSKYFVQPEVDAGRAG